MPHSYRSVLRCSHWQRRTFSTSTTKTQWKFYSHLCQDQAWCLHWTELLAWTCIIGGAHWLNVERMAYPSFSSPLYGVLLALLQGNKKPFFKPVAPERRVARQGLLLPANLKLWGTSEFLKCSSHGNGEKIQISSESSAFCKLTWPVEWLWGVLFFLISFSEALCRQRSQKIY